jgi:hypothetical protein
MSHTHAQNHQRTCDRLYTIIYSFIELIISSRMRGVYFIFALIFIGLAGINASEGEGMNAVRSPTVGKAPARNTLSNPTTTRRLVTGNARTQNWNENKWSWSPWGGGWGPSPTKTPTLEPINANAWGSSWGGKGSSNWVVNGWNWGGAWANDAWTGDGWSWSPKNPTPTMSPLSAPPTAPPTTEPTNLPTPAPVASNPTPNPTPVPTPATSNPTPSSPPTTPPTPEPTNLPTPVASFSPSSSPSQSSKPSFSPSLSPSQSLKPSFSPSSSPSQSSKPSFRSSIQPSTSSMPSTSSVPSYTEETKIKNLLVQHNISDLDALDDPSSPQACAYEWIIIDPIISPLKPDVNDDRIIQRYVLAVLFCATKGNTSWVDKDGWLTGDDECVWDRVTCSNATVTRLNLYENQLNGNIPTELGTLTDLGKFSFPAESNDCVFTLCCLATHC